MPFELANRLSHKHLIVQPCDARLNPPESYLYIQDGLIISCGVIYALCYAFYMMRTYKDKYLAGTVLFLPGAMAYEIYYAIATTTTTFERVCFSVWFMFDILFATISIKSAYAPAVRGSIVKKMIALFLAGLAFFHTLCQIYPDEREQVTAYWTGLLIQLPVGWGHLYWLLTTKSTRGQSLEIWLTRYLGCVTAYLVFTWRYKNVPENWSYVGSIWSIGIIAITMLPETVYPFVHIWVHNKEVEKGKRKAE